MRINHRKTITSALLILICSAAVIMSPAEDSEKAEEERSEGQEKEAEINELEAELEGLRLKLKESILIASFLKKRLQKLEMNALLSPNGSQIDPRWKAFQFDGQTYYTIPLGNP